MIGSTNFSLAWLVNLLPTSGLSFSNRDLSTAIAKELCKNNLNE